MRFAIPFLLAMTTLACGRTDANAVGPARSATSSTSERTAVPTSPGADAQSRAGEAIRPADFVVGEANIVNRRGEIVIPLPADRSHGAAAAHKKSSAENDLVLPALEAQMTALADPTKPMQSALVIELAPSTPYRLLVEVLFTGGVAKWSSFDLRLSGQPTRHVVSAPPSATRAGANWAVLAVRDGISLKGAGGNVAPGCKDTGPGLAIAKRAGQYDLEALSACARALKALAPEERAFTMAASPQIRFDELLAVVETMRGPKEELFPDVTWGLAR